MRTLKQKMSNKEVEKRAIETVREYLTSHGKKAYPLPKGEGDLCYDDVHVEVKGRVKKREDEEVPYITLGSQNLTKFFKENPDRFEVWVVRNLCENEMTKHQIVKIKGTELKRFLKDHPEKEQYHLQVKLGEEFWHDPKRFEVLK